MAAMPINKDRARMAWSRATDESRRQYADRLLADKVISQKARNKFLDCKVHTKEFRCARGHVWYLKFGTCGMEICSVCVIHRERERARKAWSGIGGWGTLLTPVFTLPERFVDRVDRKSVQGDLEVMWTWLLELFLIEREPELAGQGWRVGARWDWDLSGDKSPGKYRPHGNGAIPAYLHRLVDRVHELRAFDPVLDLDRLRSMYCSLLSLYFGERVEASDLWSQYARGVAAKRHWAKYSVMAVADESTYDGMSEAEMDKTVDPRLWTLQRRGSNTGWMKARNGWSVEAIRAAAAEKGYWKDVVLEPAFQLVKGGKKAKTETELWAGVAAGDAECVAILQERAFPSLPEGEFMFTTTPGSSSTPAEPGEDREFEGEPCKATGRCPVCPSQSISARRLTEEITPELSLLKRGVWVRAEDLKAYQDEIYHRKRLQAEWRERGRITAIAERDAKKRAKGSA
jgi:hypothetical protein